MKTTAKAVLDIIVYLLILLFIYASVFKLLDFKGFSHYINVYSFLGKYISSTVAIGIPLIELCVAGLLFIPKSRLAGLYASAVLMLGFTVYIGYYALVTTTHRPCACGGILNNMGWMDHLILNVVFTLLAITGIFLHTRRSKKAYSTSPSF